MIGRWKMTQMQLQIQKLEEGQSNADND